MSGEGDIEIPVQRRRLAVMLTVNLICLALTAAAAVGMIAYHAAWAIWPFAGALLVGFAAHLWLMLGLSRAKGGV